MDGINTTSAESGIYKLSTAALKNPFLAASCAKHMDLFLCCIGVWFEGTACIVLVYEMFMAISHSSLAVLRPLVDWMCIQ